jgi:hypothetical protein
MRRRCLAVLALALMAPASAHAFGRAQAGDAVAFTTPAGATIHNAKVERTWSIDAQGAVLATGLKDVRSGTQWATSGPDFQLTLDEAPTSSTTGWRLGSVEAREAPAEPSRPDAGPAVQLTFTYELLPAPGAGPELVRTFTLHPGSAVVEADTKLVNHAPVPVRVGATSLDQIVAAKAPASNEVLAYHGGTDWRDDYRVAAHPAGAFDQEGEVARFDDGHGAGWFHVAGTRGGSMWRAGLDAANRSYVGADWPRDAFDYGPLQDTKPNQTGGDYNRMDNPLYPVPVRERLAPAGGELAIGAAYTGVYAGGAPEAGVAFAEDFTQHVAPRLTPTISANSFHPWNHGSGMSGDNISKQVDIAADLGIERYMLDDQWQGGPGGESGDWRFDPARFPDRDRNGLPDVVDHMRAKGVQLALWMSPLEFHFVGDNASPGDLDAPSQTYEAHPDWACAPTGNATAMIPTDAGLGVWDVTNPGFQDYLTGVIDRLVHDYDVKEFKFDFMTWTDCGTHDYLDYEAAWVALVRRFERRHPDVQFEFDETNDQRSFPFEQATLAASWFDNGHTHGSTSQQKLFHDIWIAAPWLPTSQIGMGALDGTINATHSVDEMMPLALLSHITFWTDLSKIAPADQERVRFWLDWYRAHRATLAGAAYELTGADPIDGKQWAAFQPWRGDRGVLFAFRQDNAAATQTFALRGVDPDTRYDVVDAASGHRVTRATGAELAAGLDVTLPPNGAAVLAIDPV